MRFWFIQILSFCVLGVPKSLIAVDYRYPEAKCVIYGTEQDIFHPPTPLKEKIQFTFGGTSDPTEDEPRYIPRYKNLVYFAQFVPGTKFVRLLHPPSIFENPFVKWNFNPNGKPIIFLELGIDTVPVGKGLQDHARVAIQIPDSLALQGLFSALGKKLQPEIVSHFKVTVRDRAPWATFYDQNKNDHFDLQDKMIIFMSSTTFYGRQRHPKIGSIQFHLPKNIQNGLSLHLHWSCEGGYVKTGITD